MLYRVNRSRVRKIHSISLLLIFFFSVHRRSEFFPVWALSGIAELLISLNACFHLSLGLFGVQDRVWLHFYGINENLIVDIIYRAFHKDLTNLLGQKIMIICPKTHNKSGSGQRGLKVPLVQRYINNLLTNLNQILRN